MFFIVGFLIGLLLMFFYLRPKLKVTKKIDNDIEEINNKTRQELIAARAEVDFYNDLNNSAREKYDAVMHDITNRESELNDLIKHFQDRFEANAEKIGKEYQRKEEEYKEEYLKLLEDYSKSYNDMKVSREDELNQLAKEFERLKSITEAAVNENKRKKEIEDNDKFYRLVLSDIDLQEIKKLKEVSAYLRDAEPLNKVIWKVYYENPTSDMIGRVVGSEKVTGIYKITNVVNGMNYVGQCKDAKSRFKQHIKRGLGAEPQTRNKLYPAMAEFGVENFTFEIIEKCPEDKLNEREDFWQEYFKSKEFGYSIK